MRPIFSSSTVVLLFLIGCSCSSTRSKAVISDQVNTVTIKNGNSSLEWKPNVLQEDFIIESIDIFKNISIGFQSFEDSREFKENVGSINQNGQSVIVIPHENISSWCAKNLISACRFLGLKSVGKTGAYSFEGEITSFSIQQDVTLHGKIGLSLSISKDGLTVWEGRVEGNSELYLIPTGSTGISECFSNALINVVYNLLNDNSFADAVNKSKE